MTILTFSGRLHEVIKGAVVSPDLGTTDYSPASKGGYVANTF